jgi:predicted Zn-dependent peptidase
MISSRILPTLYLTLALAATADLRADIDRTHPPMPGPEPAASFPDYQQQVLPNGLKVFIVESHEQPTVTFRLLIKNGDASDPAGRTGVADTTASLLNRGTAKRSAAEFAEETDFIGASVEAGSGEDDVELTASGLTKDLPKLLDLFSDAALRPTFPEEELVKQKTQAISSLAESRQRPSSLAAKLRGKLLYGAENPYGAFATEQSIAAIQRSDLVSFHDEFFTPDNATLAVVGDVKTADVMAAVTQAFAGWKVSASHAAHEQPLPAFAPPPTSVTVDLVDRPGSVQSSVVVCRRGVARNVPEAPELGVLNGVLGGGLSGRLFQNLREKHGYTYGASSGFSMNRYGGLFSASAEVRNAVTLPAIQEIFHELTRIDDEPVPDAELSTQRHYLAGSYLLSLESPVRTAERVQEIDFYKLPADYYRTYVSRVDKTTPAEIKSLADKYLGGNGWTVVVVGEAKEIAPQLQKLGPVTVYDTDLKIISSASPAPTDRQ